MNFAFFIAKRYFSTNAPKNFIHRMRLIASLSVGLSTMALLLVLSIFNGLEDLIKSLLRSFDPDIKIELKQGKTFRLDTHLRGQIDTIRGVAKVVDVIEDNALFSYQDHQIIAKIKGVSDNFLDQSPLAAFIAQGNFLLKQGSNSLALIGMGIQYALSIRLDNDFETLQVFYPRNIPENVIMPQQLYNCKTIQPGAVFAIEKYFDENYVIVPLDFAARLLGINDQRTALEVQVSKGYPVSKVQHALKACLPEYFKVLNSHEQQANLLRAIRIERISVFFTFSGILLIASLNIFFILSMLVLNKRKDIALLYTLGAMPKTIQAIFLLEGLLISLSGAALGIIAAWFLSWVQETFGLVSLGIQTGIVEAYPIKRQISDFIYTALSVVIITLIATYRPALLATKTTTKEYL